MTDDQLNFSINTAADDPDRMYIRRRLREWTRNEAAGFPPRAESPLTIVVKDEQGKFVGGMWGEAFLGCLDIYFLWVEQEYRGCGVGSRIMQMAEKLAKEKGCSILKLDTFNFQAPDFYKKLGFTEFGRVSYYPGGPVKCFFQKKI